MATDYAKFDKIVDSDADSEEESWRLSEAEIKAKKEAKREAMVQKELRSFEEIDEKLARAEKLPPRKAEVEPARPNEPGSWADDRDKEKQSELERRRAQKKARDAYRAVEGVLSQLADDQDFQADLKRPTVVRAIKHWTNEARLPPDEAQELFAEDSPDFRLHLKPVLGKLNRLSAACRAAGFGVPMEAVWTARRHPFSKRPEDYVKERPELGRAPKEKKSKRAKAEEKFLKDLPPPTPFTWRTFLRQLAIQFLVMGVVALFFRFHVEPKLDAAAEAHRIAEEAAAGVGDAPAVPAPAEPDEFNAASPPEEVAEFDLL